MFRMLCEYKQQALFCLSQCIRWHSCASAIEVSCISIHDVYCLTCAKVHVPSACSACLWCLKLCGVTSAPSRMTWCLLSLWSAVYVVFLAILGSLEICHLWSVKYLSWSEVVAFCSEFCLMHSLDKLWLNGKPGFRGRCEVSSYLQSCR